MELETWLKYGIRLWWAGLMYIGTILAWGGPFALAGAGFWGWHWTRIDRQAPRQVQARLEKTSNPAQESNFTLR